MNPAPRPLAAFAGAALYVDAMLLVAFIDGRSRWHPAARRLFGRAVDPAELRLITATLTLDDVVFVLLQELVARPPYAVTRSRSQYLAEHPTVVRELMRPVDGPVQALTELLQLEPVLPEDVVTMRREVAATGLLPRDAIHVAVMRRLGLSALASADAAFDRCPDLARYAP